MDADETDEGEDADMVTKLIPYEGIKPYLFVSYAHKDSERVLPLLNAMHEAGYRIWYDEGIPWAENWKDTIASHLDNCTGFLAFLSGAYQDSKHCQVELFTAVRQKKPLYPVRLDKMPLPDELEKMLGHLQMVKIHDEESPDTFVKILDEVEALAVCKVGWTKSGQIQWRVDDHNTLTITKNEDLNSEQAAGTIPDYQADFVKGGSNAPWMLSREQISEVRIDDINSIGSFAFRDCGNLRSVTIPNSVASIGESAFSNCRKLPFVDIPDSVSGIGKFAFEQCGRLTDISIPDSVSVIEESTFSGCVSLTKLKLPDSVTDIRAGAFVNCKNLANIVIPDSVKHIREGSFLGCERLSVVEVPENVMISPHAFDTQTHVIRRTGPPHQNDNLTA